MNEQTRICLENADLALRPPELITPVPREYYPEIDDYTMSSGIARTPGGRFYLSWFGRDDGPDTVMLLARSDDEGKSWSEPEYLIDPGFTPDGHHLSALVGTVWCDPAGRLWWFLSVSVGYYDGRAGVWAAVCGNPDDEHPAWGKPFRLWHGCALNKPTVLSTGEWALPVSLWRREQIWVDRRFPWNDVDPSLYAELDPLRGANLLVSTDNGRNWELRGRQRSVDPCFDENICLERRNGTLVMYARDQHGIVSSHSADGGWSWTPFRREWRTASARFFTTRLPSGNWLMVRHDTAGEPDRLPLLRRREELARRASARRTRRHFVPGRIRPSGRPHLHPVRPAPRPRRNSARRLYRSRCGSRVRRLRQSRAETPAHPERNPAEPEVTDRIAEERRARPAITRFRTA